MSEKSPTLGLKCVIFSPVSNPSTAALRKFNAVAVPCTVCACLHLSAVVVLTLKTTFFSPLSGLISREADGKLICTCSLPAVVQILRAHKFHHSCDMLTPPHLFKTC